MSREPKYTTQKHREWVTLALTRIKSDAEHIKEKVTANEEHLSKLNGRIGKTENSISRIQGIGSAIVVFFSVCFSYFFSNK